MSFTDLKNTVIDNDYCCGCGLCAAVCPARNIAMVENAFGELIPEATEACHARCNLCQSVCPFADGNNDEDEIGHNLFGREDFSHHDTMGWVRNGYVGRVSDINDCMHAPSGGMTTAVLAELMRRREIDAAIVLEQTRHRPWFRSIIAESPESIFDSRGSGYHITDHAESLRRVIEGPERRYAIVALPCVAKGLRLAQKKIPKLKERITYILGLTCGSYRSRLFADILAGLAGSREGKIQYRSKQMAKQANDFSFCIGSSCKSRAIRFRGLFGFLWMNGIGELKSCLFCDDIFAEVADAAFMDAWLPEYIEDPSGRSLILSRNPMICDIIEDLFRTGACSGKVMEPSQIETSQLAVVEKKRSGLTARCQVVVCSGWAPKKRFAQGESTTDHSTQIALKQLRRWEALRSLMQTEVKLLQKYRGILLRIRAWKTCWSCYRKLRSQSKLQIFNWRAVYFAQEFHPRAALRKMFKWCARHRTSCENIQI